GIGPGVFRQLTTCYSGKMESTTMKALIFSLCLLFSIVQNTSAFMGPSSNQILLRSGSKPSFGGSLQLRAKIDDELEETTKKYGLEAGLFKSMQSEGDGESKVSSAKELLKKYGSAYLVTSISLAIVSFSLCYVMVDNGVDVAGLLSKVGIETSATSEKVGTFAIAYAAHKAASPIRFPPTVALTPVVANLLG
ncbi:unnamed protein product, partial [Heterosigma akashiwo]